MTAGYLHVALSFAAGAGVPPATAYLVPRLMLGRERGLALFRRMWAFLSLLEMAMCLLPPMERAAADGAAVSLLAAVAWDWRSRHGKRAARQLGGRALAALAQMATRMRAASDSV